MTGSAPAKSNAPARPLDVKGVFKQHFGYTPHYVVQAPGRLEVLGNHTDYNQGLVLSLAIDRYIWMAASPRVDGKIELVSSAFPTKEKFWMSDLRQNPDIPWTNHVKGVLKHLRKRGVHFSGFNAAVHSNLPMGSGLGSSGALQVATALMVRRIYPYKVTDTGVTKPPQRERNGSIPEPSSKEKLQIAKICMTAENEFVGVRAGMLDQISSLFAKEYQVMEIDFMHHTVEQHSLIGELAVVVLDTGVKHEHVTSHYNEIRGYCESAAKTIGLRSLRSLEPRQLQANKARLSEREYDCAFHVMAENRRVVFGERALREDDLLQFGQYMYQSHESSRDFLKNSCAELDLLVSLAREHPGCVGARLTGGGFGGATINLVIWAEADEFIQRISKQYTEKTGQKLSAMRCRIVDGAE